MKSLSINNGLYCRVAPRDEQKSSGTLSGVGSEKKVTCGGWGVREKIGNRLWVRVFGGGSVSTVLQELRQSTTDLYF